MSNEKELVLFCRADGKWAVYDDTYDITIHCESKQEQDKTMELLRKVNRDTCEVMSLEDLAHCLMDACHCHLAAGNGCPGCPFEDRKALTVILAMNGYTVRMGKEKRSGKSTLTYFVEYWRADNEG